jgi:O-antigen ligase
MGARNYANERRAFWPGKRAVRKGFTLLGFLGLLGFLVGFVRWEPAPYDILFFLVIALFGPTFSWRSYQLLPIVLIVLFISFHIPAMAAGLSVEPGRVLFYAFVTFYLSGTAIALMGLPKEAGVFLLRGYEVAALVSAFLGVLAFLRVPGLEALLWGEARAFAFFKDPNVFGAFLVPAFILALARWEQEGGRRFWTVLLLYLGILSSLSRGAWVNVAVSLLGWWFLRPRRRIWVFVVFVLLIGFTAVYAFVFPESLLVERLGLKSYDADRFSTQEQALRLALERPLGYGPGLSEMLLSYAAHNTYVRLLFEVGWMGFGVWLLLMGLSLVWAAYQAFRQRSLWHEIYFASLLGILVESLVIDTIHWRHLWLLLGLIWAKYASSLPHHPR